jgi:hypothetical protein
LLMALPFPASRRRPTGFRTSGWASVLEVRTYRFDTLVKNKRIEKIAWVKIDTEGFDPQVLRGMEQMLKEKKLMGGIQFEYHDRWPKSESLEQVSKWLHGLGWNSYLIGWDELLRRSPWEASYELRQFSDVCAGARGGICLRAENADGVVGRAAVLGTLRVSLS